MDINKIEIYTIWHVGRRPDVLLSIDLIIIDITHSYTQNFFKS